MAVALPEGTDPGLHDISRGGEIRLPQLQVDHLPPCFFNAPGFGFHFKARYDMHIPGLLGHQMFKHSLLLFMP